MRVLLLAMLTVVGVKADTKAMCHIAGSVSGHIDLVTDTNTNITKITGHVNNISQGKHGFHVHEKGDLGNQCKNAGGHFNPGKTNHGAPAADLTARHAGDFGNIEAGADKKAMVDINMAQTDVATMIGLAIVVHEGEDDLGLGNEDDSLTTGHAGSRLACCIITLTSGAGAAATVGLLTSVLSLGLHMLFAM